MDNRKVDVDDYFERVVAAWLDADAKRRAFLEAQAAAADDPVEDRKSNDPLD